MGLKNRHLKRDRNLPSERSQLMERIESDLLQDSNVIGLFYGGSIGSGKTDLYSDIDLRIVVKDNALYDYINTKLQRAEQWGDVLFYEQADPRLSYTVVHYRSFVKVDCFYYRLSDLKPSVWLKDITVVKDTTGGLKKIQEESQKGIYQPGIEEFEALRGKLFAYFHEAYRRIRRKEWSYAHSMILGLKWLIAAGWLMEKDIHPNAFGDWSKIEGEYSPLTVDQLELLKSWKLPSDDEQLLHVLHSMVPAAKASYQTLCEKLHVAEDYEQLDEALELIL